MAVKFFNIRSGLEAVADTEPKIAALWSSSDHSPNITQGQDLGWRLAPEVVVEIKRIKQDITTLERIAARYRKGLEDMTEIDILHWISDRTELEKAPIANIDQYADDYDKQVQAAEVAASSEGFDGGPAKVEASTTTTTTRSIADLEAELAARKAAEQTTTTTKAPSNTSTTTQA
jgi:hypothetical protein